MDLEHQAFRVSARSSIEVKSLRNMSWGRRTGINAGVNVRIETWLSWILSDNGLGINTIVDVSDFV